MYLGGEEELSLTVATSSSAIQLYQYVTMNCRICVHAGGKTSLVVHFLFSSGDAYLIKCIFFMLKPSMLPFADAIINN